MEAETNSKTRQVTRVAIIRTDVFGALAYHAKCMECPWQSIRYTLEAHALKLAKAHRCGRGLRIRREPVAL